MSEKEWSSPTHPGSVRTISVSEQLLQSLRDREYRTVFVAERLRTSIALQIRALRQQREMSQSALGAVLGMKQAWVSKLEDPEYGKMTVATLIRLAEAFDTDLEIKFRPFSQTIRELATQDSSYFAVSSFDDEYGISWLSSSEFAKAAALGNTSSIGESTPGTGSVAGEFAIPKRGAAYSRWLEPNTQVLSPLSGGRSVYGNPQCAAR